MVLLIHGPACPPALLIDSNHLLTSSPWIDASHYASPYAAQAQASSTGFSIQLDMPQPKAMFASLSLLSPPEKSSAPSSQQLLLSTQGSASNQRIPGIRPKHEPGIFHVRQLDIQQLGYDGSDESKEGSDEDESEGNQSGSGGSSGQPESDNLEDLLKVKCGICRKALIQQRGKGQRKLDPADIKLCDGCHCGYHGSCTRRRGMGVSMKQPGGRLTARRFWYCSNGCESSHQKLLDRCSRGVESLPYHVATPLQLHLAQLASQHDIGNDSSKLSWALVDCAEAEHRQLSPQGERMDEVVLLLSQQYGPFIVRQVDGSDYGLLLRQGDLPLGAAMVECFGADACAVDLMASTQRLQQHCSDANDAAAARDLDAMLEADERGVWATKSGGAPTPSTLARPVNRGVARALVGCLEDFLGSSQVASRLLGIVDDPLSREGGAAMDMWKQLGYRRMTNRQVHQLHESYPLLATNGDRAVFFAKSLQGQASVAAPRIQAAEQGEAPASKGTGGTSHSTEIKGEGWQRPRSQKRFGLTARLWGWAARQLVHKATFGMV